MSNVIKPTVGRRVWYFGSAAHYAEYLEGKHVSQPYDAGVLFVHDDRTVNLLVTDHTGNSLPTNGAQLFQEGDPEPNGAHARWMPYQTGQAQKETMAEWSKRAKAEFLREVGLMNSSLAKTLNTTIAGDEAKAAEESAPPGTKL